MVPSRTNLAILSVIPWHGSCKNGSNLRFSKLVSNLTEKKKKNQPGIVK